jgi:hypothetical protein
MEPNNKNSELLGKNKQLSRAVCKFCGTIGHTSRSSKYCKANIDNNINTNNENLTETTSANDKNDDSDLDQDITCNLMETDNKDSELFGNNKQLSRAVCKFCGTIGHTSRSSQYCKANIDTKINTINECLTTITLENEINDSNLDQNINNKFIWPKIRSNMDNYKLIFNFENKTDPNNLYKFTCTICSRVPIVNNTKVEQHLYSITYLTDFKQILQNRLNSNYCKENFIFNSVFQKLNGMILNKNGFNSKSNKVSVLFVNPLYKSY